MRRRRSRRPLAAGAALAIVAFAATAAWLLFGQSGSGPAGVPAAISPHPVALRPPTPAERPKKRTAPPGIDLIGGRQLPVRFRQPPRAGIAFDLDSGEVLWRRNAMGKLPIASLTKIMTAILVVDRTRASEKVRISRAALRYSGSGVGVLPRGRRVPVEALLHGLMLPSGNDAAIALAVHIAGSDRRFARLMNREARRLGLTCTRFVSSYGLERGNRSCAADLAALSRVAMGEPRIARVVRKRRAHVRFPIKTGRLWLNSTNPLLLSRYRGAIGLKTGFTDAAGRCFVGVVRRGNRRIAVVLLHSPNPLDQSKRLIGAALRRR